MGESGVLNPQQVLHRHLDVDERKFGGVRGFQAQLVELAADRVALRAGIDGEQRNPVTAILGSRRRGAGTHDHAIGLHTAGDEGLRAVEHVMAAVVGQPGGGLHPGQVGAGAWLGHRDREHVLAADESGQPALLLLVGGVGLQVGQTQLDVDDGLPPKLTPARAVSSFSTELYLYESMPAPPYSSGTSMPKTPSSPSFKYISRGTYPA